MDDHADGRPVCVDLFCGDGGWTDGFLDAGFRVIGFDVIRRKAYRGELVLQDVRNVDGRRLHGIRVVVASPPCEGFSVARIGANWTITNRPKTQKAVDAVDLVQHTIRIIREVRPDFWFIENPVGKLRSLHIVPGVRKMVTQCQYGAHWRKPTDIWGTFPFGTYLRPPCSNGDPCHESAPRGARSGVQGTRNPFLRARIPYELARSIADLTAGDT